MSYVTRQFLIGATPKIFVIVGKRAFLQHAARLVAK